LRTQRHTTGSVRYDKRRKTWNYLWYDGPTRRSKRIGTKQECPTKAAAWKEVDRLEIQQQKPTAREGNTLSSLISRYEAERMPTRHTTARVYRSFLNNHIIPKRGIRTSKPHSPARWRCGSGATLVPQVQNACPITHARDTGVCDVVGTVGSHPQPNVPSPKQRRNAKGTQAA
jgi:hypothetical protein